MWEISIVSPLNEIPSYDARITEEGFIVPYNPATPPEKFEDVIRRMTAQIGKRGAAGAAGANKPAGSSSPMLPLLVKGDNTWEKLSILSKTMNTTPQGPSLAAYRAHLLVNEATSSSVTTGFCKDVYVGKRITDIPTWATLNSLYFDGHEMGTEEARSKNKTEWQQDMLEVPKKTGYASDGVPTSFEGYTFQSLVTSSDEKTLCAEISDKTGMALLKKAHAKLRVLYDNHIQWVAGFMMRFVDLSTIDGKKVIRFNDTFMSPKPNQTVQDTIEQYIRVARKMLLNHYVAVENVYTEAVKNLRGLLTASARAAVTAAAATAATVADASSSSRGSNTAPPA
jgi:hypothetical protein